MYRSRYRRTVSASCSSEDPSNPLRAAAARTAPSALSSADRTVAEAPWSLEVDFDRTDWSLNHGMTNGQERAGGALSQFDDATVGRGNVLARIGGERLEVGRGAQIVDERR